MFAPVHSQPILSYLSSYLILFFIFGADFFFKRKLSPRPQLDIVNRKPELALLETMTCICVSMYVCECVYVYVCVSMYICIYVCIYLSLICIKFASACLNNFGVDKCNFNQVKSERIDVLAL